jgi:exosortase/archaeosortase family protein
MLALFDPKKHPTARLTGALFLVGAIILAVEPLLWLVRTWTEPAYDSPGGWIFLVAAGLFAWSVTSPLAGERPSTRHALWLLGITALVRLASQLLALNVLGALALVIDVYALSVLAGLAHRKRAVSPLWIAGLFAFSLPVERIFQRLIGYALQHVSAAGSCGILGMIFDDVACSGVEIMLAGKQVLVDLPCSGARGLVLLSVLFCGLAAVARPTARQALAGLGLAVLSALVANSIRIAALAIGLAFPQVVGVDVMATPWHDLIGLAALAFGLVPLVMWARAVRDTAPDHPTSPPRGGEVAAKRSAAVGGGGGDRPRSPAATTPTPSASALDDAPRHLPHSGIAVN